MRLALQTLAWLLKVYARLAKVWPLSFIAFAWWLLGTPHILIDEHAYLTGDDRRWSCTYRALWAEETLRQDDPCLPIMLVRG